MPCKVAANRKFEQSMPQPSEVPCCSSRPAWRDPPRGLEIVDPDRPGSLSLALEPAEAD